MEYSVKPAMSSSPSLAQHYAPYLSITNVIVKPISTLTVTYLVYGFYIALFGRAVYILHKYKTRQDRKLYLWWTISLFGLASLLVLFETWLLARQALTYYTVFKNQDYLALKKYLNDDTLKTVHQGFVNVLETLINIVADTLLIHRCYIIWRSSKLMAGGLIFLSFIANAWSLADDIILIYAVSNTNDDAKQDLLVKIGRIDSGSRLMIALVNMLMTLLTAGRIWWLSRQVGSVIGDKVTYVYRKIVIMILESGALYPLTLIIWEAVVVTQNKMNNGIVPIELNPLVYQMAGIAPTLIIVRAAAGKAVGCSVVGSSKLTLGSSASRTLPEFAKGSMTRKSQMDTMDMELGRYEVQRFPRLQDASMDFNKSQSA